MGKKLPGIPKKIFEEFLSQLTAGGLSKEAIDGLRNLILKGNLGHDAIKKALLPES